MSIIDMFIVMPSDIEKPQFRPTMDTYFDVGRSV